MNLSGGKTFERKKDEFVEEGTGDFKAMEHRNLSVAASHVRALQSSGESGVGS